MMTRHPRIPLCLPSRVACLGSSSLVLVLWLAVSAAQVRTTLTPDGTLGTTVTSSGNVYTIMGGTRPGNGPNLFHSFDRFSVGTGDTAHFTATGPAGIVNILSRVTGGQRSEIDGKLQSTIPGAHLYLLNPNGVIFGPHATLDVQGSFHVSTADYLRLADGARFSAHLSATSTLSTAPPEAFGFWGPTPAPIMVNGSTLPVPLGETFSIVGGHISIAGTDAETAGGMSVPRGRPTLDAPAGHVQLVSMTSAGEVGVPSTGQLPDSPSGAGTPAGQLDLTRGARVTVSSPENHHAGTIVVRAGILTLTAGAIIDAGTVGTGHGGRITIEARDVRLEGANTRLLARTDGRGDGGAIAVQAGTLTLTAGAQIDGGTGMEARGPGGRVSVVAHDVRLENGARIRARTTGRGDGGTITVQADTLTLKGEAGGSSTQGETHIDASADGTTAGVGRGGHVTIEARDVHLMERGQIMAVTRGPGAGGTITVQADTLTLTGERARIDVGTAREGHGGHMTVVARDVRVEGGGQLWARAENTGAGGAITIQAGTLTLTGNAQINASTSSAGRGGNITVRASEALVIAGQEQGPALIVSDALRRGDAGHVVVSAPTVRLDNGRIQAIVNESGTGGAAKLRCRETRSRSPIRRASVRVPLARGLPGRVTVTAKEAVRIVDEGSEIAGTNERRSTGGALVAVTAPTVRLEAGGAITAAAGVTGQGGAITVDVGTLTLTGGGRISSSTEGKGQGGAVTVRAREAILLAGLPSSRMDGRPSGLFATTNGPGPGGDIVLQAPTIQLIEGATISARSTSTGPAGAMRIQAADALLLSGASTLTTEATQADGGIFGLPPRRWCNSGTARSPPRWAAGLAPEATSPSTRPWSP